jgi:chromosome transmission fidelity protein 4
LTVFEVELTLEAARQNLRYTVIDTDTFEIIQEGSIPMMKQTTLQWIGFTDDQIPALYKSNGVLSLLHRSRRPGQARWVPSLDTNLLERREGKQESYWPVSVSNNQLHCVILKGEDKYPSFPTPLLQELPLQIPACSLDNEQGRLEES